MTNIFCNGMKNGQHGYKQNTEEGREMQRNAEKCREMKRNLEKCREIYKNVDE